MCQLMGCNRLMSRPRFFIFQAETIEAIRRAFEEVCGGPHPTINGHSGANPDRHEQKEGDQRQYGVLIEMHEFVHAAIVIAPRRWGHCNYLQAEAGGRTWVLRGR